jgi:sulfite reductase beta subunit-like hemoprotein
MENYSEKLEKVSNRLRSEGRDDMAKRLTEMMAEFEWLMTDEAMEQHKMVRKVTQEAAESLIKSLRKQGITLGLITSMLACTALDALIFTMLHEERDEENIRQHIEDMIQLTFVKASMDEVKASD